MNKNEVMKKDINDLLIKSFEELINKNKTKINISQPNKTIRFTSPYSNDFTKINDITHQSLRHLYNTNSIYEFNIYLNDSYLPDFLRTFLQNTILDEKIHILNNPLIKLSIERIYKNEFFILFNIDSIFSNNCYLNEESLEYLLSNLSTKKISYHTYNESKFNNFIKKYKNTSFEKPCLKFFDTVSQNFNQTQLKQLFDFFTIENIPNFIKLLENKINNENDSLFINKKNKYYIYEMSVNLFNFKKHIKNSTNVFNLNLILQEDFLEKITHSISNTYSTAMKKKYKLIKVNISHTTKLLTFDLITDKQNISIPDIEANFLKFIDFYFNHFNAQLQEFLKEEKKSPFWSEIAITNITESISKKIDTFNTFITIQDNCDKHNISKIHKKQKI